MKRRFNIVNGILHGCAPVAIGLLLGALACLAISLGGCKAQRVVEHIEVPVVTSQDHSTETTRVLHTRDTIVHKDSVFHFVHGDTVRIERWHFQQGISTVTRVDTVHTTDSIQVPVTITQTIEKEVSVPQPFSWWQTALLWFSGLTLIAIPLLTAYNRQKR